MEGSSNMSTIVANIDIANLSKPRPMTEEVIVGKDVLELLAGAMYADPLTIFREYVQNAADSIDVARAQGLDPGEGFGLVITLDRAARTILVRDNGAGIPASDFAARLTSIGASQKRGKALRGFRGVGRLSGLGYCQEILFRGRAEGDAKVVELRWDGRRLRDLLRDSNFAGDLSHLVRSVVEIRKLPAEGYPARFFEVELRKVTRLRGDLLLNDDSVRSYLSQVAPVPFHPSFRFGPQITAYLRERGVREPIEIRMTGDEEPIYHRARDHIEFSGKVRDAVQSIEFLEFLGHDGNVEAFGWILDHAYLGAVPRRLGLGGIRLRTGNIQVGDESILSHLFVEPRFAGWAIGDIHIESKSILPNARRDEFEASVAYAYLQDDFTIFLKRISQTVRDRSLVRNRIRKAQAVLILADQWLDQARDQDLPVAVQQRVRAIVQERISEAQKQLEKIDEGSLEAAQLRQRIGTTLSRRTKLLKDEESTGGRRSAKDKAIDVAISVILEHAATPSVGLTMSKRVLRAFEAS
jgi:molecular chaperone HtpG